MRNPTKKKTYLDEVIEHAKRDKFPAPGHYNLAKSQKEIDAELKKLASKKVEPKTKISYLDEVQFCSNMVPGPGNYNPHVLRFLHTGGPIPL